MGRVRYEVADEVREAFAAAEAAAEQSAAATARCVAVVVDARRKAKLPPTAAAEAIALISKGCQSSLEARQLILAAHPLLTDLGRQLGVLSFGPDGGCVPNLPLADHDRPLRVVGG